MIRLIMWFCLCSVVRCVSSVVCLVLLLEGVSDCDVLLNVIFSVVLVIFIFMVSGVLFVWFGRFVIVFFFMCEVMKFFYNCLG